MSQTHDINRCPICRGHVTRAQASIQTLTRHDSDPAGIDTLDSPFSDSALFAQLRAQAKKEGR